MKLYKNRLKFADIATEIFYFHTNMNLLAFHADIT